METTDISQQVDNLVEAKRNIISQLKEAVAALPDNPKINRVGDRSFTVSSAQIFGSNNWSAFFHDHKAQHAALIAMINGEQASALEKVLEQKRFDGRAYAPEVIETAKPFIEIAIKLFKTIKQKA